MKIKIAKLEPKGPIHLGERENIREGSGAMPYSDTIFSAICHCLGMLYGPVQLEKMLAASPPWLSLSSGFPYWGDKYYWPVPLSAPVADKDTRKAAWVETAGLPHLLAGGAVRAVWEKGQTLPLPHKEGESSPSLPWRMETIPRIGLNRLTNHPDDRYFQFGQVVFSDQAGIFFAYRAQPETEDKFKAAVRLMADEGLGGDRSSGKGAFRQPEFLEIDLPVPEKAEGAMLLSLCYPGDEKETEALRQGSYTLVERRGYVFSPMGQSLRRRSVRLFSHGSTVAGHPDKLRGKLVDVTPEAFTAHRVYRNGLAYAIPCMEAEL